ncbi:MAG: microcystin degradation protein MlrC [Rhodospirillales bacterium 70-18]|nr:M81 family metallopeptidase [Rhodospirillales bacterium]OJY73641.1 MAG: microcystin degradation protein MlrC [Rhodospirillales bacterium 70-18]
MRLLLATMSHETNTFSPVPTKLARFCRDGTTLLQGEAAIAFFRNTGTCMGGYLEVAAAAGAEIVLPVAASAPPSGRVDAEAYETFCRLITDEVKKGGFDGIMLDLHGAMAVETFEDGEGELLRRIREIDPNTPMAVAYDMHANVFDNMVSPATIVSGYHTYPHIDMAETARRAGRVLLRAIAGEVRPTGAWGAAPMLPHVMAQGTHQFPNKDLQAMCQAWEESGRALSASLFVGFPHADVTMAGLSAVVFTDNNPADAQAMVDELLAFAWKARRDFMFDIEKLDSSVARAKALGAPGKLPVVLLDHYDNCASGGTMDTTDVLREIIRQELDDVVFFGIYDPEAVQQAIAAGIGSTVTLSIGAKLPMPLLPVASSPLTVTGRVRTISAGYYTATGGLSPGLQVFMGTTVVLDTGRVQIVLLSRHVEPTAQEMLQVLGIDPAKKKYVAIKSRVHWRADLGKIAREIVECAGVGVCTSDYGQLTFRNVRRPIFPLDPQHEWNMPKGAA